MTKPFDKIAKKWSKDPEFQKAYDELAPEFALARSLIEAPIQGRDFAPAVDKSAR